MVDHCSWSRVTYVQDFFEWCLLTMTKSVQSRKFVALRCRLAKKMTKLARDRASVEWDPRQYYYRRKPRRELGCHGGHAKIDSIAPMKLGRIKGSKQGGITWRPYSRGGEFPSGLRPRIPAGNTRVGRLARFTCGGSVFTDQKKLACLLVGCKRKTRCGGAVKIGKHARMYKGRRKE